MRPLHAVAAAVVLITLDFRTTSVDLLPDVVGWLLLAWAALRLARPAAMALAGVGGVASLALLSLPYHYEQVNPFTGEIVVVTPETDLGYAETLAYDSFDGWRLAAFTVSVLAFAAVLVLLGLGLRQRAAAWDGPSVRQSIKRIGATTALLLGLWVVPRLVAVGLALDDGYEPIWDDPAARIALAGAVAAVAYAVSIAVDAREPWAVRRRAPAEPVSR